MPPAPADLLDRRLLFVTGKGGVGKTSMAAALALLGSQRGKRTLACEVDAKGNLSDFFEAEPNRFEPQELSPGLFSMAMNTEESLKEYLRLQLKVPLLARIGPFARSLDFVANAAPGVKEILTIGKLLWEVREQHYDLVVVDASATGHIVGQLAAPQAINELVKVGRVRDQTGWMVELLSDPATTGAIIVATPEEMPVTETLELVDRIREETDVDLAAVIVNKVLPELFGRGEEEMFHRLREPEVVGALEAETGFLMLYDRGGNALHRAVAHVTAREDPRDARLEQIRVALELPATRVAHVRSGEDVTPTVERDLRR